MAGNTVVEKIFGAPRGSIVFRQPDIVLSHDNPVSIEITFQNMGGQRVAAPEQLLIVLDHNAPPTNAKLANDYQRIRDFVHKQGVTKFHDVGEGICQQLMALHARPGMI
ncbi:aconitate hydratase, partial [candidate division KSB3 bacterium]|nr:aconitate hydratase [candidate division KSB3 bacterium]MBD3326184.1 aconitate hydratase [candidate division KSB3 bacterium]